MAGSATLYLEQKVLGHTLDIAAMPAVTAVYVGLCQAASPPTSAQGGVEVMGNAYARQAATFELLNASSNIAANSATVEFPPAGGAWGTLGFFELWDGPTAGNRLYWGPLVDPVDGVTPITRNVQTGDIMRFSASVIQVQAV